MIKFNTGTGLRPKCGKIAKKNGENHIKLPKNTKNRVKNHVFFVLHQWVPVKNMTMRTAAVQPRILSKKNIFHLHINGGTQERKI